MPRNLPAPPNYKKVNPADSPILILAVHSDELPITQVDDIAENQIAQQVSRISGISQVNIGGQQKPAVRVQVDPAKIAALGIQMEDIAGVIAEASVNDPKGSINGPEHNFPIYDNDQLTKAAPWNDVIIAYRNGAPVRIRDIGVAVDAAENTQLAAWQNGRPGHHVADPEAAGREHHRCGKGRRRSAAGRSRVRCRRRSRWIAIIDRTQTIRASVHEVEVTLLISVALVVLVIFVFLRNTWATIIPALTVPLSLMGTTGVMYLLGYSLDNLSLMALTIAVGFVVDDAIVMLENIYRHIEAGMPPIQAALKGAGEIGFTILSISISLVAVFIPLLLMGGIIGRLFREFAITVTVTIAVSAFVSLTLSPMLCALFLKNEREVKHGRSYLMVERAFERLLRGYEHGLDFVLAHQKTTLLVFLGTVAASGVLYVLIPKGFFPQQVHGNHQRHLRCRAGRFVLEDGAAPSPAHRCDRERSGRGPGGAPSSAASGR